MGIYIKNIELPTENNELRLIIHSNGQVIILHQTHYDETEAVSISKHGRVIDADVLIEDTARMVPLAITDPTANTFLDGLSAAYEAIKAASTIIPVEPPEEET